ncbi:ComEA family DNA-binding protein [Demequina phytophila]|uniref:ComEA family DNA-binding protein n=1 Tax=Demequina phytophila TaxID=1638981 RepID=UPI0007829E13|nr:ComEA family DNA-binding protein [Demequina phytophila]
MDSSEDVRARWAAGLRDAAARAYAAGHGAEPPAPHPTRWRLDLRTAATAIVVLVIIAAVAWWGLRGESPAAVVSSASPGASSGAAADASPGASPGLGAASGAPLIVHVSGAVGSPGLVEVTAGARVADAIERAGGLARRADESSVNLARPVADGEHIVVARLPGSRGGGTSVGGASVGGTGAASDGSALINLNSADATALEAIPGVGPVLAARIVEDREANGPFLTLEDLERVSGVGPSIVGALAGVATT